MQSLKYSPEQTGFYKVLTYRVNQYFKEKNKSKYGNNQLYLKLLFLGLIYLGTYSAIYFVDFYWLIPLYSILGISGVILGLNAGHDAAHNAVFKRKKYNKILLYVFDILGTNSDNWKNRHIKAHHPYPNISGHDSDIQQTKIVRIFPQDQHEGFHNFQVFYMPFLYMIYIFRWVVYRDFKDVMVKNIGAFQQSQLTISKAIKLLGFKILYISYTLVIPYMILDVSFAYIFIAFLMLTITGSLTITLVLLCAHVGEDAEFPSPNNEGQLPHSWSYHQVLVTNDFATKSKLANAVFGGFNHHTIHHLFPQICHIHYPDLTPILKKTAMEFMYPYSVKRHIPGAIASHFKLLHQRSKAV